MEVEQASREELLGEIERLRREVEDLKREKTDLEILLETTTEHSDSVEADLYYKAEEAAKESQRRLAQFLEAVPIGVFVVDASGKAYYANQMAKQILGRGIMSDLTGLDLLEIYQVYLAGTEQLYPSDRQPIVSALKGKSATVDDVEIHQGDKIIPLEVWATPIFNEKGEVVYAIAAFQDITDRKRAEAQRNQFTKQLFQLNLAYERFVPREFLQLLNKKSIIDVKLGDQVEQEMSVLFADIRNFTTLSESMTPEENFKFINAYLSRMEPAIIGNKGVIDKYMGDAIMGLFSSDADDAVKAGIAMLHRLAEYNQDRAKVGYVPLRIGIGINTGALRLGIVGGLNRLQGTVISDTVNLAARIEQLTKNYGVSLLISHQTFASLPNPTEYAIRLVDRVRVKGKSKTVSIFEVFDADPPEVREGKSATRSVFEEALLFYHRHSYIEAAQKFQDCLRQNPMDRVALIYLERCQRIKNGDFLLNQNSAASLCPPFCTLASF
ncbi:MAG TPA: adenylate cyclase [Cyanobacteria bacterium UBA8803]|nr:adenylate cyclase [Cyanobacteria bacterium UBA9273]HBL60038.1 adenylate cyclase [Cyanobacteria bacterium UBA8803]